MKSFLKNVVQRKEGQGGVLLGRTVKVGPFTVRVESHLADGGFACIYKVYFRVLTPTQTKWNGQQSGLPHRFVVCQCKRLGADILCGNLSMSRIMTSCKDKSNS